MSHGPPNSLQGEHMQVYMGSLLKVYSASDNTWDPRYPDVWDARFLDQDS